LAGLALARGNPDGVEPVAGSKEEAASIVVSLARIKEKGILTPLGAQAPSSVRGPRRDVVADANGHSPVDCLPAAGLQAYVKNR
jgi:hypothetical protein